MDALMNDAPKDITIIKLATLTLICMIGSFATTYAEQVAILTTDFKMVEDKRIGIGNILKRVPLGIFSGNKAENISATLTSTLSSVELSAAYTISGVFGGGYFHRRDPDDAGFLRFADCRHRFGGHAGLLWRHQLADARFKEKCTCTARSDEPADSCDDYFCAGRKGDQGL
jgi:hypothetical protein